MVCRLWWFVCAAVVNACVIVCGRWSGSVNSAVESRHADQPGRLACRWSTTATVRRRHRSVAGRTTSRADSDDASVRRRRHHGFTRVSAGRPRQTTPQRHIGHAAGPRQSDDGGLRRRPPAALAVRPRRRRRQTEIGGAWRATVEPRRQ